MDIKYLYIFFLFCFVTIYSFFLKYKLYKSQRYTIGITLFTSLNIIITAYTLLNQSENYKISNIDMLTKEYNDYANSIYNDILQQLQTNPKEFNNFFNLEENAKANDNKPLEISDLDRNICLQINNNLSNYAIFYYSHIKIDDYVFIVKSLNYRILKIIGQYLTSRVYVNLLNQYLNTYAGVNILKWYKEFFNISATEPMTDVEIQISKNTIIDGKIKGKTDLVAPSVNTSLLFETI